MDVSQCSDAALSASHAGHYDDRYRMPSVGGWAGERRLSWGIRAVAGYMKVRHRADSLHWLRCSLVKIEDGLIIFCNRSIDCGTLT